MTDHQPPTVDRGVDFAPLISKLRRGVVRKVANGRGGVRVDIEATEALLSSTADILTAMCGPLRDPYPEAVIVPRAEMKYTLSQAVWKLDEGNTTEARVLVVQAQNILRAAPQPPAALDEAVGLLRGLLGMADALTAEHVAEGVHTGLRKGTDAADSHTLWQAISGSETSAWGDACAFFAESMTDECVGFGKQIEAARAFLANLEPSQ